MSVSRFRTAALLKVWQESIPKRNCLKCDKSFQPNQPKINRVCDNCKKTDEWRFNMQDHSVKAASGKVRKSKGAGLL